MLELRTGVFVGSLSPVVREKLWREACRQMGGGAGMVVYEARNEQGFEIEFWGATDRWIVDYDGLKLVRIAEGA